MADDDKWKRKQRGQYKPGNTAADGNYIVGKGRPPKQTQFARGDGRKRGRRPKGQKNLDTEFLEEAMRKITIREGGKDRKVSKFGAVIIRALNDAAAGRSVAAVKTVFEHGQKIEARRQQQDQQPAGERLEAEQADMVEAFIKQEVAKRVAGPHPGDPEDPPDEGSKDTSDE